VGGVAGELRTTRRAASASEVGEGAFDGAVRDSPYREGSDVRSEALLSVNTESRWLTMP
jgi:hypothetical protein